MSQMYQQSVKCIDCDCEIDVSNHQQGVYPKRCNTCRHADYLKRQKNLYARKRQKQKKLDMFMEQMQ